MAFFNGYPATYSPYTPAYAPVQQNTAPPVQGLNWVQGEAGAKSFLVAPNNTVALWDSEAQVIYLKSADVSGMPSMKVLDYTIRDSNKNSPNFVPGIADENLSIYATKDEIKAISGQISTLRDRVDSLMKRKRREDDDE